MRRSEFELESPSDLEGPSDDRLMRDGGIAKCFSRNQRARSAAAEQYLQRAQAWSCLSTESVDASAAGPLPVATPPELTPAEEVEPAANPPAPAEDPPAHAEPPVIENTLSTAPSQAPLPEAESAPIVSYEPRNEIAMAPKNVALSPQPPQATSEQAGWLQTLSSSWTEFRKTHMQYSQVMLIGIAAFFLGLILGMTIGS